MKDVILIQSKIPLRPVDLEKHREGILEQLKTKVIIIPSYLKVELINVPDDIEVIMEGVRKCENTT